MSDDESAIRRLLADYCHLLDDGRFDEWIELFDPDAVFVVMGNRLRGRDELRDFIEPTQQESDRGRHMLSEPAIRIDGDTANAATDFVFVSRANAIMTAGRYLDEMRRAPDRWRFTSREIVFSGDTPSGSAR
jgi:uncharacterized protein (TIGR02246 family)